MANIDFDSIQTITDEQLLKAVRLAIANLILGGKSYSIAGRTFQSEDLDKLKQFEKELADRVGANDDGGFVFARFE